jgi:phenylacetate-CoA ligase
VAIECLEAKAGLHMFEDHFLPEVINPATLEPQAPGETGELVITTLTKEAFPLLRYRTRDLTSLNYAPCICGRTMARISVYGPERRYADHPLCQRLPLPDRVRTMEPRWRHYQPNVDRKEANTLEVQVEVDRAPSRRSQAVAGPGPEHPEEDKDYFTVLSR